jgi:hypothetical protein
MITALLYNKEQAGWCWQVSGLYFEIFDFYLNYFIDLFKRALLNELFYYNLLFVSSIFKKKENFKFLIVKMYSSLYYK